MLKYKNPQSALTFSSSVASSLTGPLVKKYIQNKQVCTVNSFPSLGLSHSCTPARSVPALISPSLPRRLINWSGFTTSFCKYKKRHDGILSCQLSDQSPMVLNTLTNFRNLLMKTLFTFL